MSEFAISVVMPALNEEADIERAVNETLSAFTALGIKGEILIIDDGSTDQTGFLSDKMAQVNNGVRVIHHTNPRGIGASFWEGANAAKGDVVTMLPGDGENDPLEILRYFPLMREVDIVIPFVYNVEVRGRHRRWISRLYKAIINLSFGMLLNYMNGTVMYRRAVLQTLTLNSRGFFYQTELLIKAIRMGFLYAEVPYALGSRTSGRSTALTFKSFIKLSKDYLATVYNVYFQNRKRVSSYPNQCITAERRSNYATMDL